MLKTKSITTAKVTTTKATPTEEVTSTAKKYCITNNVTNKLSLQVEALSNCDNFTVIAILQQ